MTQRNFIFGGDTGLTYADLVRSRERGNQLLQGDTPRTFWGGLGAIGEAFIGKSQRDKADKALKERNRAFRQALLSNSYGQQAGGNLEGLLGLASDAQYSPEQQNLALEIYRDRLSQSRQPRTVIQGADGYQYYQDDGSRVLPNVTAPAPDNRTTDQKNYDAAVDGGFTGSFNDWLLQKRKAGATNVTTSVNTGVDRPKPPAGYDYARTDTGDVAVDESNQAQLVPIQGGPAEAELAEKQGEKEQAIVTMDAQIELIDRAINHPGLAATVGPIQGRLPTFTDDTADFNALREQLQGGVFLQAFESLKGGGQITEIESQKAENAMARLSRVQSDDGFRDALRDLKEVITDARARATGGDSEADILAKYGLSGK